MYNQRARIVPRWFLFIFSLFSLGIIVYGIRDVYLGFELGPGRQNLNANIVNIVNTTPSFQLPPIVPPTVAPPPAPSGNTPSSSSGKDLNDIDPSLLRSFLEKGGIPKADLDKLDDATLLQIYNKTFEQYQNLNDKANR